MNKKYFNTLLIPSLQGQHKLWKSDVLPQCQKADAIVNFGNIIGCHPQVTKKGNERILSYLNLFRTYSENWTQLIGPNEIAALNAPDEWTNFTSIEHLQREWLEHDGLYTVACESNNRLLTHGGLTHGEWESIDKPQDAKTAAQRINEKYSQSLYQGPSLRIGDRPNISANPIWTDALHELYPSWIGYSDSCPFDQIVASVSLNSIPGRKHIQTPESLLSHIDDTQFRSFGSIARIGEAEIISIDLELNSTQFKKLPPMKTLIVDRKPLEK